MSEFNQNANRQIHIINGEQNQQQGQNAAPELQNQQHEQNAAPELQGQQEQHGQNIAVEQHQALQNRQSQNVIQQNAQNAQNAAHLQDLIENRVPANMPHELTEIDLVRQFTTEHAAKDELLADTKYGGDSDLMDNIKKSIRDIDSRLDTVASRDYNLRFMPRFLGLYETAIKHCAKYLRKRHSKKPVGIRRRALVEANMRLLKKEAGEIALVHKLLTDQVIDEQGNTTTVLSGDNVSPRLLIGQARLYTLAGGGNFRPASEEVHLPAKAEFDALGAEAGLIYNALSGAEQPSDLIRRLSKSKKTADKEMSRELPEIFTRIEGLISGAGEGRVTAEVFTLGGSVIAVSTDSAGRITVSAGGSSAVLERNTGTLTDVMRTEIVRNAHTYGERNVRDIIVEAMRGLGGDSSDITKRRLLTDYIVSKTGKNAAVFGSFDLTQLMIMCRAALTGIRITIVKKEDAGNYMPAHDELVFSEDSSTININENRVLLKESMKDEKKQRVRDAVKLSEKRAPEIVPGEPVWDEREAAIRDFVAELFYSNDTWNADELRQNPGERVRKVLLAHPKAVSELMADCYREGEYNRSVINKILDRMPLFVMSPEEAEDFRETIHDVVSRVCRAIDRQIKEETDKLLPKVREEKALVEQELAEMDEARRQEELRREQEEAEEEARRQAEAENQGFFSWAFSGIVNFGKDVAKGAAEMAQDAGSDAVYNLKSAKLNMLKNVDDEAKMRAEVVKHLSDPAGILRGDPLRKIPSLEDIVKNKLKADTLAVAETRIGSSTEKIATSIQKTVSKFTDQLFSGIEEEDVGPIPDENAPGLSKNERLLTKRERYKKETTILNNKIKKTMSSGEKGQGLFTKLVFENYFSHVSGIDQRSMIASMIKNAKPVKERKVITENMGQKEREQAEAYNRQIGNEAKGNYIGGLLKGAGPLLQKMMQGLPEASLPTELKSAVEDMKSKLAPIPDEVVQAQLFAIVERSHKQIESIQVKKPLGAASVGQTFLCTLHLKGGKTRDVAIKLLKPDVRNRMMREKEIMLECARKTDMLDWQRIGKVLTDDQKGGMQNTYEGQLLRIEEELDLTIEARNVELGKIYDKEKNVFWDKHVKSMKVDSLVAPTTNSMVLEKAPGETIDSYLKRIDRETEEIVGIYKKRDANGKPIIVKENDGTEHEAFFLTREQLMNLYVNPNFPEGSPERKKWEEDSHPTRIIRKLNARLADLKKKKKYLETFGQKWVAEGVFGEGFFHGDPHDGNLMVDDDGLTVIDFGNCTRLDDTQKLHVTRIVAAASVGETDIFMDAFKSLLRPEFQDMYETKRQELRTEFEAVLKLGDAGACGLRIAACIIAAQEMGFEVPAPIQNFSQAQLRISNTLDNFNNQIEKVEKQIERFMGDSVVDKVVDISDYKRSVDNVMDNDQATKFDVAANAYFLNLMSFGESTEDFKVLSVDHAKTFYDMHVKTLEGQTRHIDNYATAFRETVREIRNRAGQMQRDYRYQKLWVPRILGRQVAAAKFLPYGLIDEINVFLMEGELTDANINAFVERIQGAKTGISESIRKYKLVMTKVKDIKNNHKDHFRPTEAEDAEFTALVEDFRESYLPFQRSGAIATEYFAEAFRHVINPNRAEDVHFSMDPLFEDYPEYRDEFWAKYGEIMAWHASHRVNPNVNLAERRRLEKEMFITYQKVMAHVIRKNFETYKVTMEKEDHGFVVVVGRALKQNLMTAIGCLSIGEAITIKKKNSAQRKETKAIKKALDEAE